MTVVESRDHTLAPKRKHAIVPARRLSPHDRDVDRIARQRPEQPVMPVIDGAHLDIGIASPIIDERCVHIPGGGEAWTPIVNKPSSPLLRLFRRRSSASTSSRVRSALRMNSNPMVGRRVPPLVRSNNTTPSRHSMSRRRRLRVDWRMFRASAACLRLRCCDAVTAKWKSKLYIHTVHITALIGRLLKFFPRPIPVLAIR